jgi:hypothetical protein
VAGAQQHVQCDRFALHHAYWIFWRRQQHGSGAGGQLAGAGVQQQGSRTQARAVQWPCAW